MGSFVELPEFDDNEGLCCMKKLISVADEFVQSDVSTCDLFLILTSKS